MEKKEGKIPANARVDVDYSQGKPKIKFTYTSKNPKKDALRQNYFNSWIFYTIILIWLVGLMILTRPIIPIEYPKYCQAQFDQNFINISTNIEVLSNGKFSNASSNVIKNYISGGNITCNDRIYTFNFPKKSSLSYYPTGEIYLLNNDKYRPLKITGLGIAFLIDISLILILINSLVIKWLVKQEWYKKWLPKHQAGGKNKRKYYYKFKSNDVLDNVIIIPKFRNVELVYKTNGDFSKKLTKIKIREYRSHKYRKGKIGKLKVDNYTWYAIFYFKEKPKNGYMEVIYQ